MGRAAVFAGATLTLGLAIWSVAWVDRAYLEVATHREMIFPQTAWKPWLSAKGEGWWWANRILMAIQAMLWAIGPGLGVVMLARIVRGDRRAARRPGFAAVALGCLVLVVDVISFAFDYGNTAYYTRPRYIYWSEYSEHVGPAIVGAWGWFAASRRWRAPSDWPEHLGRLYGWGWVFMFLYLRLGWAIVWG